MIQSLSVMPAAFAANDHERLARETPRMVRLSAAPWIDFLSPPCRSGEAGAPVRLRAAETFWRLVPSTAASAVSDNVQSVLVQSIMLAEVAGASKFGGEFSGDCAASFGSRPVRPETLLTDECHLVHPPFGKRVQAFVKAANRVVLQEPDLSTCLDLGRKSGAGGIAGGVGFGLVGSHGVVLVDGVTLPSSATNATLILQPTQKTFDPGFSPVNTLL